MKKILNWWPILFFALATVVYFWKVFLKGYVPFPGDLLVGAYLPWLDNKWGFPTGVPVKNPLISDIMSQFFIWRSLVSNQWRAWQIPLWNPFSYSGYPLLATFHSGVFYPLNIFHIWLGNIRGWSFLVVLPSFASALTMYLYLRKIKVNKLGGALGAIVYAYAGFAISWAQFITAAQAMIWMPLVFLVLEKFFESKRALVLYWLPLIFFLLVTSGHFQIMVYVTVLTGAYYFWRWFETKNIHLILQTILPAILAVGLSSFQLLPTLELAKLGLRFEENYISAYNYGLLPIKYLTTLYAPDFFGNPATGNFFGAFNYHEAIFYCGALAILMLILSLALWRSDKYIRFYWMTALVSFMVGFDTFLGRAIYIYNVPGISTSAAGRIAVIFSLSLAVLTGIIVTKIDKLSLKKVSWAVALYLGLFGLVVYLALKSDNTLMSGSSSSLTLLQRRAISLRNLYLPGILVLVYSATIMISKKWKNMIWLLLLVVPLELFRFGWKYIPFVPERIVFPQTPIISFLEDKAKTEVFRIDREKAEIMPPATWMQYGFMSPSGYDPMAVSDYVKAYQKDINGNPSGVVSRYSELDRYDSVALGKFNVKYLVVIKRDKQGKLGGDQINYTIDMKHWKKVSEEKSSAVLENLDVLPRARYVNSKDGEVKITQYTPNVIKINFTKGLNKTLLLADTDYPGWKAFLNNKELKIERCEDIFRCVTLPEDQGLLTFSYQPDSFWTGVKISLISLVINVGAIVYLIKKKK